MPSCPVTHRNSSAVSSTLHGRTHLLACVLLIAIFGTVQADNGNEAWQFRLTPYVWLPTIDGSLKYQLPPVSGGGNPNVSVGPTDWLDLLNYGLLVGGSAKKGRFSVLSDFVYLSMTSKNDGRVVSVDDTVTVPGTRIPIPVSADLNLDTRTDLDGLLWTLTAGYAVSQFDSSTMDVFAGVRYFDVEVATRWDLTAEITVPGTGVILPAQGGISSDTDLWDGIIGVRGEIPVGEGSWSVPYYFDVGEGDSDRTWSAFAGLARNFGWGDLLIAYRHLEYDQAADSLLQDFSFGGPAIGARFQF